MTNQPPADTSGVTILPPIVFATGLIAGYVIQILWRIPIVPTSASLVVRLLGVLAILFGGWAMVSAVVLFRRIGTPPDPHEPSTRLALDGPYRFTRNPMYLGMAAVLAGLALIGNALWPLLALIPVIWWIRTQVIAREERYLEAKFGGEYWDFKARVRRWL